jgi:hypothetical protein
VDVYKNLTRGLWSIRVARRVVGHVPSLTLRDVRFIISLPGVHRIRLRQAREVVAFARGLPSGSGLPDGAQRVRFDPYRSDNFTLPDGAPICAAALVLFASDGSCWAVPSLGDPSCVASSPSSSSP